MKQPTTVVVVPCYNEARRLDIERYRELWEAGIRLLFVDDGSTDGTAQILETAVSDHGVCLLRLHRNGGKAEAVRLGMIHAISQGADAIGYLDADLATPPAEMNRLISTLYDRASCEAVLGARVALLGRSISRRRTRHYAGRIFATTASAMLRLPIYDTQCGAKVFRASPAVSAAVSQPFHSRWTFDVELLGRIIQHNGSPSAPGFVEVPLDEWTDVPGSKLSVRATIRAGVDLLRVRSHLRKFSAAQDIRQMTSSCSANAAESTAPRVSSTTAAMPAAWAKPAPSPPSRTAASRTFGCALQAMCSTQSKYCRGFAPRDRSVIGGHASSPTISARIAA